MTEAPPDARQEPDRSILPRGLRRLIVLRYRGTVRRMLFGSGKQRAFGLLGLGLMSLYLIPMIASGRSRSGLVPTDQALLWLPVFVILIVVVQAAFRGRRSGFSFLPSEIDLVIPGPFSRRQLLVYQLAYQSGPTILMATWLAAFVRSEGTYAASVLGITLTAQCVMVGGGLVSSGAGWLLARRGWPLAVASASALAAVAWVAWHAEDFPATDPSRWLGWATEVRRSAVIEAVCLPLLAHARTMVSASTVEALPWAAAALGVNVGLAAAHLALDRSEIESIVSSSQKRIRAQQAAARGGALMVTNPAAGSRLRLPLPPRMGGIGPLIWRQWLTVYRGLGPITLGIVATALVGIPAWAINSLPDESTSAILMIILPAVCFALSLLVSCDFRADLDHMAWLKSLPLKPSAIVAGQTVSSAAVIVLAVTLAAAGTCLGAGSGSVCLVVAGVLAGCVPITAALIIIENLVFLVAPTRPMTQQAAGGFDPSQVGRHFVVTMFKIACIGGTAVLAGAPVGLILWAGGGVVTSAVAGCAVLAGVVGLLYFACVKAFVGFDVSADLPA